MAGQGSNVWRNRSTPEVLSINPITPSRQPTSPRVDNDSPSAQVFFDFDRQSLFTDATINSAGGLTDPSYAILPSPKSQDGFITSTMQDQQHEGYGIAIHPDSQVPVGLIFGSGSGQRKKTQSLWVLPGQIVRPHGLTPGSSSGAFNNFKIGLPFGWLGGGLARIVIMKSPDAKTWSPTASREILYHQITLKIGTAQTLPNWPARFPWSAATSQVYVDPATGARSVATAAAPQGGTPGISLRPSKTILTLQTANLPTGSGKITVTMAAMDDAGFQNEAGASIVPVDTSIIFPQANAAGMSSLTVDDSHPLTYLSGDAGIVSLLTADDASLTNISVNIARYGYLE